MPFYSPELSCGFDRESGRRRPTGGGGLARRLLSLGFVVLATECYPLNIMPFPPECSGPRDLALWYRAAGRLQTGQPGWSGIGKRLADARLALDVLLASDRVDPKKNLAIGHGFGGKVAMYLV